MENNQLDIEMLKLAFKSSAYSPAKKRKVGAIITCTGTDNILSSGFNRNLNLDQDCENINGETYNTVIHAEEDAITCFLNDYSNNKEYYFLQKTLYCTFQPCINCCRLIVIAGITKLVYCNSHKTNFVTPQIEGELSPKQFLEVKSIEIVHIPFEIVFPNN